LFAAQPTKQREPLVITQNGQDVTLRAAPIPAVRSVAATAVRARTCEKIGR
jgi:hypothetical protein